MEGATVDLVTSVLLVRLTFPFVQLRVIESMSVYAKEKVFTSQEPGNQC